MMWTQKNMQSTSLRLCGLYAISHFNWLIKKESKYLQKSI